MLITKPIFRKLKMLSVLSVIVLFLGVSFELSATKSAPPVYLENKPNWIDEENSTYANIYFPYKLGDFYQTGVKINEVKSPGLGVTVWYSSGDVQANVYIYDLGDSNIPTGIASGNVKKAYLQALSDIENYRGNARELESYSFGSSDEKGFYYSKWQFVLNGKAVNSYLLFTGKNNKFFKIRLSIPQDEQSERLVMRFMKELAEIIHKPE